MSSTAAGVLLLEKGLEVALEELRRRAAALVDGSCEAYDVQELRSAFRGLVDHIKFRLEVQAFPAEYSPNTSDVIHYIARVCGKNYDSVYTWQSDSKNHYPIPWGTLELLRLDEWAIANGDSDIVEEGFRHRMERHQRAAAAPREIVVRTKRATKPRRTVRKKAQA